MPHRTDSIDVRQFSSPGAPRAPGTRGAADGSRENEHPWIALHLHAHGNPSLRAYVLGGAMMMTAMMALGVGCSKEECNVDSDCAARQQCSLTNACVDVECRDDVDCPSGELCYENACEARRFCGAEVTPCGCSGAAQPGTVSPASICESGMAEQVACSATCPGGGVEQQTVCYCERGPSPDGTACTALPTLPWTGELPCTSANNYEASVLNELQTVWLDGPAAVCSNDGGRVGSSACGALASNDASYCPTDDSIEYDDDFMNNLLLVHRYFAPMVVLAHEWGHMNQQRLGLLTSGSNKDLELHADCQAGIFTAIYQARGRLNVEDISAAFQTLCDQSDPALNPWFAPEIHGTCSERLAAFESGYLGAQEEFGTLCVIPDQGERSPRDAIARICGM